MSDTSEPEIDPAEAFEGVRSQLSLLHSAIEGLTASREKTPDYTPTLGNMAQALCSLDARLQAIEQSRALSLSPVKLADEINAAAGAVRAQDGKMLAEARDTLSRALGRVDSMIERGQAAERRIVRERKIAVAGVVAGMLLWSVLPGIFIRSLPEAWLAPEWAASRIMGMEQAHAGKRLWQTAENRPASETDPVDEAGE